MRDVSNAFVFDRRPVPVIGRLRGSGNMIVQGLVARRARRHVCALKADACDGTAASREADCIAPACQHRHVAKRRGAGQSVGERQAQFNILLDSADTAWGADFEDFRNRAETAPWA